MGNCKNSGFFKRYGQLFSVLLFMIILGISETSAQTSSGRISGTVTDSSGASVVNATVTVSDPSTNFSRTVMTDESGFYTVTNLPVATYIVAVEMQNFKKSIQTENALSSDGRVQSRVALASQGLQRRNASFHGFCLWPW